MSRASTYCVWERDRVAHGPLGLDELAQLLEEGKIHRNTWVYCAPEDQWYKVAALSELHGFYRSDDEQDDSGSISVGSPPQLRPEMLRKMHVFSSLDDRQLEGVMEYLEVLAVPQFSHILRKGDHGDAMYILLEGEVRALTVVDGREATLTTIGPGGTFGEVSLLDQGLRAVDVIANRDSLLGKLSSPAFERLLQKEPGLAVPILLTLSRAVVGRVRYLTKRYEDSVHWLQASAWDQPPSPLSE